MIDDTTQNDPVELEDGEDLANKALSSANQASMPAATPAKAADPAALGEALTALQNVIERNADELDRIREEMSVERDALKNIFENDNELSEAEEQATVTTQKIKERKSKIQTSPEVVQYKTKISELNEQKKEIEEALNNHLLNLYQITGVKTFDTSSGRQREFSIKASLKSTKPQNKD